MKDKIVIFIIATIIISFSCYFGYQAGYSHGERKGYQDGTQEAWSYYPHLELKDVAFVSANGITVEFGQLTIVGEQHIIDFINDLPNMDKIIRFEGYNENH